MRVRHGAAAASAAVVAVTALVLLVDTRPTRGGPAADRGRTVPAASPARPADGAREDCATRSEALFPGAFADPRNLVVGPLVLVGGTYTDATTVRRFGGNKFPLLVKAGHRVTVALPRSARRLTGLAYGPMPQGEVTLRDTYRAVTFVACRPGAPDRRADRDWRDGPSGSYADDVAVTFWSGFVITRAPSCVPLDVYVDDEPAPRRAGLGLGGRCASTG